MVPQHVTQTDQPSGFLESLMGNGSIARSIRRLILTLENEGTVNVEAEMEVQLKGADPHLTNSGTIHIGEEAKLQVSGGPTTQTSQGELQIEIFDSKKSVRSWGRDWSLPWTRFVSEDNDGVIVEPFLQNTSLWSQREQIIAEIIDNVQQDVNAYGIEVRRWNSLAVEKRGETTVFLGENGGLDHVASDIDFGNNSRRRTRPSI